MKGDNIANRLLDFGASVIDLLKILPSNRVGRHIADQLFRSATSGGANYDEARRAQSRRDFAHKVSIAAKEMGEAAYWLGLVHRSHLVPESSVIGILIEANELVAILTSSAKTATMSKPPPSSTLPVRIPCFTSPPTASEFAADIRELEQGTGDGELETEQISPAGHVITNFCGSSRKKSK